VSDEQQYPETGTGWPDAAAEPGDTGWPSAAEPVTTVDAVPAGVTITPDEDDTIALEEEGTGPGGPPAGPDESRAEPDEWRTASGEQTAQGGQSASLTDPTIDLSRAGGEQPGGPGERAGDRPGGPGERAGDRPGGPGERAGDRPGGGWRAKLAGWASPRRPRLTSAGAVIGALIALLGFALAVQLRSHTADPALASARQEDLVRILSDLEAREERSRQEISDLEERQRQLSSGAEGRQAALQEATKRADELGILAGTLPAQGPGLTVRFDAGRDPVRAEALLDAIQELRGAGAEAMQIAGGNGTAVRVVASTYVVDGGGGIDVDGRRLTAPYTITVIGDGQTMRTALNIAGGVVESVQQAGGNVAVHDPGTVRVTALHTSTTPRYARPAK
jgi:uncharacterized protein YlxW (UPF0749 family)